MCQVYSFAFEKTEHINNSGEKCKTWVDNASHVKLLLAFI